MVVEAANMNINMDNYNKKKDGKRNVNKDEEQKVIL
jgi:hypothetical protein